VSSRSYIQILAVVALLAAGQLLFRKSAHAVPPLRGVADILHLAVKPAFIAALVIYAVATVMWVGVLQQVPLSRAYPFMALSFAIVPAAAVLVFGETVTPRLIVGIMLVLAGLLFLGNNG
jgi:drug/metabolite transporter (DMT)-like permease